MDFSLISWRLLLLFVVVAFAPVQYLSSISIRKAATVMMTTLTVTATVSRIDKVANVIIFWTRHIRMIDATWMMFRFGIHYTTLMHAGTHSHTRKRTQTRTRAMAPWHSKGSHRYQIQKLSLIQITKSNQRRIFYLDVKWLMFQFFVLSFVLIFIRFGHTFGVRG